MSYSNLQSRQEIEARHGITFDERTPPPVEQVAKKDAGFATVNPHSIEV